MEENTRHCPMTADTAPLRRVWTIFYSRGAVRKPGMFVAIDAWDLVVIRATCEAALSSTWPDWSLLRKTLTPGFAFCSPTTSVKNATVPANVVEVSKVLSGTLNRLESLSAVKLIRPVLRERQRLQDFLVPSVAELAQFGIRFEPINVSPTTLSAPSAFLIIKPSIDEVRSLFDLAAYNDQGVYCDLEECRPEDPPATTLSVL